MKEKETKKKISACFNMLSDTNPSDGMRILNTNQQQKRRREREVFFRLENVGFLLFLSSDDDNIRKDISNEYHTFDCYFYIINLRKNRFILISY
jgi:hypothetical protein